MESFKFLFEKLKNKDLESLEEVIHFQGDLYSAIKIGWQIPVEELKRVTRGVGVFKIFNDQNKLLLQPVLSMEKSYLEEFKVLISYPKGLFVVF